MPNYIYRTVSMSHVYGQRVTESGEFTDFEDTVLRKFRSTRNASAYFRRTTGDSSITIANIEEDSQGYRMPLETFIKYAEPYDQED